MLHSVHGGVGELQLVLDGAVVLLRLQLPHFFLLQQSLLLQTREFVVEPLEVFVVFYLVEDYKLLLSRCGSCPMIMTPSMSSLSFFFGRGLKLRLSSRRVGLTCVGIIRIGCSLTTLVPSLQRPIVPSPLLLLMIRRPTNFTTNASLLLGLRILLRNVTTLFRFLRLPRRFLFVIRVVTLEDIAR